MFERRIICLKEGFNWNIKGVDNLINHELMKSLEYKGEYGVRYKCANCKHLMVQITVKKNRAISCLNALKLMDTIIFAEIMKRKLRIHYHQNSTLMIVYL